jgi:hypothetical protein
MSDQISAWFKELIKDQVTVQYQAHGGYLDGTMMSGDVQANTVKFPIVGRTEVYQLTGAIEMVPTGSPGLSTVQLTMSDFEAAEWWRIQDAYKAGPSEQAALATILTKAIRRKRDTIKLDALATFAAAGGDVTTIGDGSARIDLLHFEQARAEIAGAAGDDDMIFAGIPAMWASQLAFYEEFGNARWVGDDNAPFSKAQRSKMRTVRDITYIELPDEYFSGPESDELYAYVWAKSAVGAETPWNQESADLSQHKDRQGSPWLAKTSISGAAVGIQGKGVKRLHMLKITAPARPA